MTAAKKAVEMDEHLAGSLDDSMVEPLEHRWAENLVRAMAVCSVESRVVRMAFQMVGKSALLMAALMVALTAACLDVKKAARSVLRWADWTVWTMAELTALQKAGNSASPWAEKKELQKAAQSGVLTVAYLAEWLARTMVAWRDDWMAAWTAERKAGKMGVH